MNPTTLRALRQHLFFNVDEAAQIIANVSPRSWQRWEDGTRPIPQDVKDKLEHACTWRSSEVKVFSDAIIDQVDDSAPQLTWYTTLDDWLTTGADPLLWRPHCSIVAEMCAQFDAVAAPFT